MFVRRPQTIVHLNPSSRGGDQRVGKSACSAPERAARRTRCRCRTSHRNVQRLRLWLPCRQSVPLHEPTRCAAVQTFYARNKREVNADRMERALPRSRQTVFRPVRCWADHQQQITAIFERPIVMSQRYPRRSLDCRQRCCGCAGGVRRPAGTYNLPATAR